MQMEIDVGSAHELMIKKGRRGHTSVLKLVGFLNIHTSSNTRIVYPVTLIVEMLVSVRKRRKDYFNAYCMNCFASVYLSHCMEILISS